MTTIKRKHTEISQLQKKLKEVDLRKEELQLKVDQLQAEVCFENAQLKKVKISNANKTAEDPKKQTKLTIFLKKKESSPLEIANEIFDFIFREAWNVIQPSEDRNHAVNVQVPMAIEEKQLKMKVGYSERLKNDVKALLKEQSLARVFIKYNRRIPKTTLWNWKGEIKPTGKSGRKSLLRILEEELFMWFLKCRARKIMMTQNSLIKKALKLSKTILLDEEVELTTAEKEAYINFGASNGWVDKFKKRYNLGRRAITTLCSKNKDEMKISLESYFKDLNETMEKLNHPTVYNMDETCVFFELSRDYTLEVKGKKIVGAFSSGKSKEKATLLITACSDGYLLPPIVVFKVAKPRNKAFSDIPAQEVAQFKDEELNKMRDKGEFLAYNTYSGWNNKHIMQKYFVPYYTQYAVQNSLLILDNHGSHTTDVVTREFENKGIKYLHLAPNTTAICQPVDVEIGAFIKGRIKSAFQDWIIDSWDEDNNFVKFDAKKKKYTYKAPTKEMIVKWILNAYEEASRRTVSNGNHTFYLLVIL